MTQNRLGFLGIMTGRRNGYPPVAEPEFCSQLCAAAPSYGLQALVFHPEGVDGGSNTISGYTFSGGQWEQTMAAPPDIVYNRGLYTDPQEKRAAAAAIASLPRSVPWSRGLPDKWNVYRMLRRSRDAAPLLPETRLYTGPAQLGAQLAKRADGVFLKPVNGTHGKRSLHARLSGQKAGGGMCISGRDGANGVFHHTFVSLSLGLEWIHHFIGRRRYIIQSYLHLTDSKGHPFDVRVLMQKNGRGVWTLTGMAVRLGGRGGLTSNLHGGGTAVPAPAYLLEEYGGTAAEAMLRELTAAAALLPPLLEASCGRLGELGLDFGIDRGGRIYLLEANSKPGRAVFGLSGDRRAARLAAENPLRYARYLLLTRGAGCNPPRGQLH
ncbi:YheC/YheD family protein ['Paenibacillus yunnanensis' Narsing Rao et al. 2020]|uniref:YheC/YheD family endospore coat-associated protein n=1 Tax=Paenibacillus tengchongensis TaxID=2608684 RepID=UPI00124C558F|nr:YheC/YheD family protein [Paenibacillus tengchongensis]